MPKVRHWFLLLSLCVVTQSCFAVGERLINAVMQSDFIFDRNISNAPFLPLGYMNYTHYDKRDFTNACDTAARCELGVQSFSQGLALPVWVGEKDMFLVGEAASVERLDIRSDINNDNKQDIYSVGVLGAWIQQYNDEWQIGAFLFPQTYSGLEQYSSYLSAVYTGAVGRFRHSKRFHSYWGVVADIEEHESWYLPYIGFDWFPNERWAVTMVMPWPAVTYAPNQDWFVQFGALYGGSEWRAPEDNKYSERELYSDLAFWDFGLAFQRRLHQQLWGSISVGISGLGKLTVSDSGHSSLNNDLDSTPFLRFGIEFRPESK